MVACRCLLSGCVSCNMLGPGLLVLEVLCGLAWERLGSWSPTSQRCRVQHSSQWCRLQCRPCPPAQAMQILRNRLAQGACAEHSESGPRKEAASFSRKLAVFPLLGVEGWGPRPFCLVPCALCVVLPAKIHCCMLSVLGSNLCKPNLADQRLRRVISKVHLRTSPYVPGSVKVDSIQAQTDSMQLPLRGQLLKHLPLCPVALYPKPLNPQKPLNPPKNPLNPQKPLNPSKPPKPPKNPCCQVTSATP